MAERLEVSRAYPRYFTDTKDCRGDQGRKTGHNKSQTALKRTKSNHYEPQERIKMNLKLLITIITLSAFLSCETQKDISTYESDNLKIERLTKSTFRHLSFLSTENFGKVACNGMVVIDNHEALIFDTPVNDKDSKELIDWVEKTLKCQVIGIVVTHFHNDCLGGLNEFTEEKPLHTLL